MSLQIWSETLISAQTDGAALNTSTTPTSLLPGAAKFQLPANYFQIGRKLRITAFFRVSNIVTTPGTLTLDVRFGSTVVFNGGAMPLNTTAKTNVTGKMEATLTCRSIGSGTAATMFGLGNFTSESVNSAVAGTANDVLMPASAPAVGSGFDSTAVQVVDLFGTWSISNAGNSITCHDYALESLN
jgi:hypothetical protein